MNNSKEKEIILYEISDSSDLKVCLKIPSKIPVMVERSKLDSIKSWEGKKKFALKNRSVECLIDDKSEYGLKFKVVTTPTSSKSRYRNFSWNFKL